ncbi:hypothetical protein PENSPDRAFT_571774 [Peniophora sp. CONT]|nr:hypothetical protein PENSPDRAFT_571774 [Peniophora sp. CONT]
MDGLRRIRTAVPHELGTALTRTTNLGTVSQPLTLTDTGWLIHSTGGGCDIPLTPYTPRGTDCSALPGVADVFCGAGSCIVRRCLPGWIVAVDGEELTGLRATRTTSRSRSQSLPRTMTMSLRLPHIFIICTLSTWSSNYRPAGFKHSRIRLACGKVQPVPRRLS